MKLSLIGSVKIDSRWRKKLFIYSLFSLGPILPLLSWRLNIVGKYASFAKKEIFNLDKNALITIDDDSSYYNIIKSQIQNSESNLVFFWQEDHWFLCSNNNLFLYLLSEFQKSEAEVLTISHLMSSWEVKLSLPIVKNNYLYKEYRVDKDSQKKVWEMYPAAYSVGIPAIYKKGIALEILEFNKPYLINTKNPHEYELDRKKGEEFLQKRSFIEMIPTFHVFREIFRFQKVKRAINIKEAFQILKLRERRNF